MNRRKFLNNAALLGAGLNLSPLSGFSRVNSIGSSIIEKPALLGGSKAHPESFPDWPIIDSTEYKMLIDVLQQQMGTFAWQNIS